MTEVKIEVDDSDFRVRRARTYTIRICRETLTLTLTTAVVWYPRRARSCRIVCTIICDALAHAQRVRWRNLHIRSERNLCILCILCASSGRRA